MTPAQTDLAGTDIAEHHDGRDRAHHDASGNVRDRVYPAGPDGLALDHPMPADGAALWRIARDSRVLDLNSSYSYLLWCRDYAETSIVARDGSGDVVGFITGYTRPGSPRTLLVWQVAVDDALRGRGVAAAMLDALVQRVGSTRGVDAVETTVTPDNRASDRLFTSFAERHGALVEREVLFDAALFPEGGHAPELLYRIGPVGARDGASRA